MTVTPKYIFLMEMCVVVPAGIKKGNRSALITEDHGQKGIVCVGVQWRPHTMSVETISLLIMIPLSENRKTYCKLNKVQVIRRVWLGPNKEVS